jgi:hypothetical protein
MDEVDGAGTLRKVLVPRAYPGGRHRSQQHGLTRQSVLRFVRWEQVSVATVNAALTTFGG